MVTAFAAAGVVLPTTRYVRAGPVLGECESLQVEIVRTFPGTPGNETPGLSADCDELRSVELRAVVFRCWPTDEQIAYARFAAASVDVAADMDALGTLDPKALVLYEESVTLGPVTVLGPNGGMVGSALAVEVPL